MYSKCDGCGRSDNITQLIGNQIRCRCGTVTTVRGGISLPSVGGSASFGPAPRRTDETEDTDSE